MKEGWDYKKLGEVTSTINGLWTGKKPPFIDAVEFALGSLDGRETKVINRNFSVNN